MMQNIFSIIKRSYLIVLIILFVSPTFIQSQEINPSEYRKLMREKANNADRSDFKYVPKKQGHYTAEDWRATIDSTWGEGMPTEKKLELFDYCWDMIDETYPSFFNIDVNWDSLKSRYRPEVQAGVSRGHFHAIMTHLFSNLLDLHSLAADIAVSSDSLKPGTPLLVVTGAQAFFHKIVFQQEYNHFGAGLAPMPDSSLFVYDVIDNHPLDLERGDIILGYDGISWKNLYEELLAMEFPLFVPTTIGNNTSTATYSLLTAAGENWHLFDTIDIVKYNNGETIHLPTSRLHNQNLYLLNTDQIPVPGVPFPNIDDGHLVSRGVVEGTKTGYIYIWDWSRNGDYSFPTVNTGYDFSQALLEFIHEKQVDGLIIDSRTNAGGWTNEYEGSLAILYNEDQDYYDEFVRDNPSDHYSMEDIYTTHYKVNADNYLFDKPIALLIGPNSVSTGDMMPQQLRTHPMVRAFGLGTAGAFGRVWQPDIRRITDEWMFRATGTNLSLSEQPGLFLTHLYISPDEEIWLEQDDVVKREDTVVKRALEWIHNLSHTHDVTVDKINLKPAIDDVTLSAEVENPNNHNLSVLAYFSVNDTTVVDSVYLTKDGAEGDNIWGATWLPAEEGVYNIAVKTYDPIDNTSRTISNVAHFTSAGPVIIDKVSPLRQSAFDPTRFSFDIFLINNGNIATVNEIGATIFPDTTIACFIKAGTTYKTFGDIKAGESKIGRNFSIYLDTACVNSSSVPIPFSIEISNKGYTFWSDSASIEIVTGLADIKPDLPEKFALHQNYPNPFNPKTIINYSIGGVNGNLPLQVDLSIYNLLGQKVATLVSEKQLAGSYKVEWDASGCASGIYLYRLETDHGFVQTHKLVLLR